MKQTTPSNIFVAECIKTIPGLTAARIKCLDWASERVKEVQREELAEGLMQRYETFGFIKGTAEFNQCLFQQNQIEIQNNETAELLRMKKEQLRLLRMQ